MNTNYFMQKNLNSSRKTGKEFMTNPSKTGSDTVNKDKSKNNQQINPMEDPFDNANFDFHQYYSNLENTNSNINSSEELFKRPAPRKNSMQEVESTMINKDKIDQLEKTVSDQTKIIDMQAKELEESSKSLTHMQETMNKVLEQMTTLNKAVKKMEKEKNNQNPVSLISQGTQTDTENNSGNKKEELSLKKNLIIKNDLHKKQEQILMLVKKYEAKINNHYRKKGDVLCLTEDLETDQLFTELLEYTELEDEFNIKPSSMFVEDICKNLSRKGMLLPLFMLKYDKIEKDNILNIEKIEKYINKALELKNYHQLYKLIETMTPHSPTFTTSILKSNVKKFVDEVSRMFSEKGIFEKLCEDFLTTKSEKYATSCFKHISAMLRFFNSAKSAIYLWNSKKKYEKTTSPQALMNMFSISGNKTLQERIFDVFKSKVDSSEKNNLLFYLIELLNQSPECYIDLLNRLDKNEKEQFKQLISKSIPVCKRDYIQNITLSSKLSIEQKKTLWSIVPSNVVSYAQERQGNVFSGVVSIFQNIQGSNTKLDKNLEASINALKDYAKTVDNQNETDIRIDKRSSSLNSDKYRESEVCPSKKLKPNEVLPKPNQTQQSTDIKKEK